MNYKPNQKNGKTDKVNILLYLGWGGVYLDPTLRQIQETQIKSGAKMRQKSRGKRVGRVGSVTTLLNLY